jgi:hypothetical protein
MQQLKEQLAAIALLGTARGGGVPPATGPLGAMLAAAAKRGAEQSVLDAAAIIATASAAGVVSTPGPSPGEPALPDERPVCSPGAAALLARMLGGETPEVLPEWLAFAAERGQRIPHELLPALLEVARRKRDLREAVRPVLDNRGRWLAKQNPDWRFAATSGVDVSNAAGQWETGTAEERLILVRDLRAQDPAFARQLIESTWGTDPPELRTKFIEAMAVGLSMEDEPLLESALDDRRKSVRDAASDLLFGLDGSRYVQRMIERTKPLLRLTEKNGAKAARAIELEYPAKLDKAMLRDGMYEEAYPSGRGKRANWLMVMLRCVPPRIWSEHFNMSAHEVVLAALHSESADEILRDIADSTMMHRDAEYTRALLDHWLIPNAGPSFRGYLKMINVLGPLGAEAYLAEAMNRPDLDRPVAPWSVLQVLAHTWSREFSEEMIPRLLGSLPDRRITARRPGFGFVLEPLRIHPAVLPPLISLISELFEGDTMSDSERAIATLHMRHACWKEFEKP